MHLNNSLTKIAMKKSSLYIVFLFLLVELFGQTATYNSIPKKLEFESTIPNSVFSNTNYRLQLDNEYYAMNAHYCTTINYGDYIQQLSMFLLQEYRQAEAMRKKGKIVKDIYWLDFVCCRTCMGGRRFCKTRQKSHIARFCDKKSHFPCWEQYDSNRL